MKASSPKEILISYTIDKVELNVTKHDILTLHNKHGHRLIITIFLKLSKIANFTFLCASPLTQGFTIFGNQGIFYNNISFRGDS
jgi:hypothetical protein